MDWTALKAEFKRTVWAAGAQLCLLLLPLGSHRPAENKCGDLIFHAGSSRIPCSIWGLGEGVQNHLQLSAYVCGIPEFPISITSCSPAFIRTTWYPPFPSVGSAGFYFTWFGRKGPISWAPSETCIWYIIWRSRQMLKTESNTGRRKYSWKYRVSGQGRKDVLLWLCMFLNLVVCSLDCAVWLVFYSWAGSF